MRKEKKRFRALYSGLLTLVLLMGCLYSPLTVYAANDLDIPCDTEDGSYVFFKSEKTAEVPIIMYHLVTKNGNLVGRYGITPGELESDLKYLQENGYETILMADLISFVYRGRPLPKKPVVLTFDDGNYSDYLYLYPLLQKYKSKAVLSVLGKQSDEYTEAAEKNKGGKYPNLTWPQIKEMKDKGFAEIQSHSYNMHGANGSAKRRGESVEAYQERFKNDLNRLQARCKEEIRWKPTTFTYPLGLISESSRAVLNDLGFSASLSCCEGMNQLKQGDPECLFQLKRNIRPSRRDIGTVLERMKSKKK